MTYNINSLYQAWLSDPEPFELGWQPTYSQFIKYYSAIYDSAFSTGQDIDPIANWIMLNAPNELPTD